MFTRLFEAIWIYTIAPVGWSDSNSDYEKENDAKTVVLNTKRLSLSIIVSDSKRFKKCRGG